MSALYIASRVCVFPAPVEMILLAVDNRWRGRWLCLSQKLCKRHKLLICSFTLTLQSGRGQEQEQEKCMMPKSSRKKPPKQSDFTWPPPWKLYDMPSPLPPGCESVLSDFVLLAFQTAQTNRAMAFRSLLQLAVKWRLAGCSNNKVTSNKIATGGGERRSVFWPCHWPVKSTGLQSFAHFLSRAHVVPSSRLSLGRKLGHAMCQLGNRGTVAKISQPIWGSQHLVLRVICQPPCAAILWSENTFPKSAHFKGRYDEKDLLISRLAGQTHHTHARQTTKKRGQTFFEVFHRKIASRLLQALDGDLFEPYGLFICFKKNNWITNVPKIGALTVGHFTATCSH